MTCTKTRKDRRCFIKGVAGAAAVTIAAPFISRGAFAATNNLVLSSWGGSLQDALREVYFTPFEKETGVKIVERTYGSNGLARLRSEIAAGGPQTDLLDGPPFWVPIGEKLGVTAPVDYTDFVDKNKHIPGAIEKYGYGYSTVSWGVGWNTESFPDGGPKNWADAWDANAFPGLRGFFGPIAARHLEYALMAAGVAPSEVYPLDAAKEDQAFAKLAEVKPNVGVWFDSFSQAESLLLSREIDVCEYVNGRAFAAQDSGYPIDFTFEQAVMNPLTWVVAKDAPNMENAQRFLAFSSRPDRQAALANKLYYGPTNSKGIDLVTDQKTRARLPTEQENMAKQIMMDSVYWAEALGRHKPRWTELTSG